MDDQDESPGTLNSQFMTQVELRLSILRPWIEKLQVPWRTEPGGEVMRDAAGELIPDFAPTNKSRFCKWKSDQSSPASGMAVQGIRPISRTTLDKYPILLSQVEEVTESLAACLTYQLEHHNKTSIIKSLEAKVEMLEKIVNAQQGESRNARLRLGEVTTAYRKRHNESQRVIAQLKVDVTDERKRVAELIAAKVRTLPLQQVQPPVPPIES